MAIRASRALVLLFGATAAAITITPAAYANADAVLATPTPCVEPERVPIAPAPPNRGELRLIPPARPGDERAIPIPLVCQGSITVTRPVDPHLLSERGQLELLTQRALTQTRRTTVR
jgi:hypothetical protein